MTPWLVNQTSASWNQIANWLRQLAAVERNEPHPMSSFVQSQELVRPSGFGEQTRSPREQHHQTVS